MISVGCIFYLFYAKLHIVRTIFQFLRKQVGIDLIEAGCMSSVDVSTGHVCQLLFNPQVLVREGGRLSLLSLDNQEENLVEQEVGEAGEVGGRNMSSCICICICVCCLYLYLYFRLGEGTWHAMVTG